MADDENQVEETEAEGEGEETGDVAATGGNKLILIVALGAVLVGGAVAAGVFFFLGGEEPEPEIPQTEAAPVEPLADVAFFDVPQISVNLLSDGTQVGHYLKIKTSLEVESEADVEAVQKVLPRLQDDFQTYLRQLRLEDIKGAAGMQRLRQGLLMRAQQSAAPARVRNILFKEIVVQ